MKTLLLAAAMAASLVALPAAAATYLFQSPPGVDGSVDWVFGNSGGIPAGAFSDTFDILIPGGGTADGSVTATFTSKATDLLFTGVSFDGHTFTLFDPGPGVHDGSLSPFTITGGLKELIVSGISPGASGDYSGTLSFAPVPEPATWALMIMGFGGLGAVLRSRRTKARLAAA